MSEAHAEMVKVGGEYWQFIEVLAKRSGDLINRYFGTEDFQVELKSDASPVTIADRQAEELMRNEIRLRYPDHGIIGEEFGNENEDAEFVWILDPIDGTISFASGSPLFGTLIGLLHRGKPVLGCIHQPVIRQLLIGNNEVTKRNGNTVSVSSCENLSEALLLSTDVNHIEQYQDGARFDALRKQVRVFRTWGDCFGYLLVSQGKADLMADPILNPWDLLPVIPVVRGAGGVITAWDGSEPGVGTGCLAGTPAVHAKALEILHPGI